MEEKVTVSKHYRLYDNLMALAMVAICFFTVITFSLFKEMTFIEVSRAALFLILLTFITVFYIKSSKFTNSYRHSRIIIAVGFSLSVITSFLNGLFDLHFLWILGAVLVASFVDTSLSFFIAVLSIFLMSVSTGDATDAMVYNFIMCAIVIMVAKFFKGIKNLLYVCMIIISCNVTLMLITSGFDINKVMESNLLYDIGSLLCSVLIVYIANAITDKIEQKKQKDNYIMLSDAPDPVMAIIAMEENEKEKEQEKAKEEPAVDAASVTETVSQPAAEPLPRSEALKAKINEILDPSYPLLVSFKNMKEETYAHCLKAAEISERAAKLIDADPLLTKAGAMYHEIGKVVSNNYIKEGIIIAKENNFPKEVIDIIKQHNSKVGAPKSPESTIVMLTDSILSSLEFMKNDGTKKITLSDERLVNGIFDSRLSTGLLDECGISLSDYKKLKSFFINTIKEEGVR